MRFTAYTYDRASRTRFIRVNLAQVPILLPFDLVIVDSNLTFYEPLSSCFFLNERGQRLRGQYTGVVTLEDNRPLPRVAGNRQQDTSGVWSYYGI